MSTLYDAIVVGARCAGSPVAMLLARRGYRVLLVDRATFPSDTISTHMIHAPGVAALARWGLRDRVAASGAPVVPGYSLDFGAFRIAGTPRAIDGSSDGYAPRRTVLDALLVDAALEAGAELRDGYTVEEVAVEDGIATIRGRSRSGSRGVERARVIVGADGQHSIVARGVGAEQYSERPPVSTGYYAYWSGLPTSIFDGFVVPGRAIAAIPTNDDQACVVVSWPMAEFETNRKDVEGSYLRSLDRVPKLAERLADARRESTIRGSGDLQNLFRKPFGPGWALVGDAGYVKDPITAQGITDAFRDAEQVADGLDSWMSGRRPFDEVMGEFQRRRDEQVTPMYQFTYDLARLQPPPAETQQLLSAVAESQVSMDDFVSVIAGTMPVTEFFAPDNVARVMERADSRQAPAA
jgi:2-polyprenyl-6-methoxyphenol hydroxylase-like FAD-dependent oxidoreductase